MYINRHTRTQLGGHVDRIDAFDRSVGGFNFDNCHRNANIIATMGKSATIPKAHKTGTTICGLVFKDGVVLGADTRATEGETICDKNCEKIHYIAPNIWCCGAGTSADTENVTDMISRQLELLRLETNVESRLVTALSKLKRHLFRYQGHVGAALVLGGYDFTGPHLYACHPHGSTDKLPFITMGSGCLNAMAVFEHGYKENMNEEEAKQLVIQAIRAGIYNDLGSGGNVDLKVIRKNEVVDFRNIECLNEGSELRALVKRSSALNFPKGTTTYLSEKIEKFAVVEEGTAPEL